MKIDGIKTGAPQNVEKKKSSRSKDVSFVQLLEGQLTPLEESQQTEALSSLGEMALVPSETRLAGLSLSQQAIESLSAFAKALDDLSLSVDDLEPLVDAIETETTGLLDIKEQLDASDPLALLVDRVAAVAFLETEKFRRGDYRRR